MLSGVGPEKHLGKLGIPVVADLPGVGQNLQDHLLLSLCYVCTQPVSMAEVESEENITQFMQSGMGPLTSNIGEAGGFVKSRSDLESPDIQFLFGPVYYINHGFTRPEGHGFSLGPCLQYPESRGSITLRSRNPFDAPAIQPNYLASRADLQVLIDGFKMARTIARSRAFDPYRGEEYWPGPQVQTDAEIVEFIRKTVETEYHPIGTCRMGADKLSVVNSRLQVHGVEGLRVVDASVMPTHICGNTNAPVIMIAEKAADLVKQSALASEVMVEAEEARLI
jgi:choline dehydrogenase